MTQKEKQQDPEVQNGHDDVPDALRNYELLPPSAYVRVQVVAGLESCSVATVWRRSRIGTLPKPEKISPNITGWNVGLLRASRAKRRAA